MGAWESASQKRGVSDTQGLGHQARDSEILFSEAGRPPVPASNSDSEAVNQVETRSTRLDCV